MTRSESISQVGGCLVALTALLVFGFILVPKVDQWLLSKGADTRSSIARRLAADADKAEAAAAQAWLDYQTNQAALKSKIATQNAVTYALGIAVGILAIGGAIAAVLWIHKKVSTIYPNDSGQWPVIIRKGRGWTLLHDPNRGLGPATLIAKDASSGPSISFALPADGETMAQVASQAQAVSLITAASRGRGQITPESRGLLETLSRPRVSKSLPPVLPSNLELSHIERLIAEDEDLD